MADPASPPHRHSNETARKAAQKARAAKQEEPDTFGLPQMFIVKDGERTFTWELRRFGGLVLQRGAESFASQAFARADGETAPAALCATPDLPTFKRGR